MGHRGARAIRRPPCAVVRPQSSHFASTSVMILVVIPSRDWAMACGTSTFAASAAFWWAWRMVPSIITHPGSVSRRKSLKNAEFSLLHAPAELRWIEFHLPNFLGGPAWWPRVARPQDGLRAPPVDSPSGRCRPVAEMEHPRLFPNVVGDHGSIRVHPNTRLRGEADVKAPVNPKIHEAAPRTRESNVDRPR